MNKEETTGVLTDSATLDLIRNYLSSEKPDGMVPVDVLHIVYLLSRKAIDHSISDSQQTLSRAFACDIKTVTRSQQRLATRNALARPQRRGRTRLLSLNPDILLSMSPSNPIRISAEAKQLAVRYQLGLQKKGRKKFPKHFLASQVLTAQRFIEKSGGDLEEAARLLSWALSTPRFRRDAMRSLYDLYGRSHLLLPAYAEYLNAKRQSTGGQATTPLATPAPMVGCTARGMAQRVPSEGGLHVVSHR